MRIYVTNEKTQTSQPAKDQMEEEARTQQFQSMSEMDIFISTVLSYISKIIFIFKSTEETNKIFSLLISKFGTS